MTVQLLLVLVVGQPHHFIGSVWCNSLLLFNVFHTLTNFTGNENQLHLVHIVFTPFSRSVAVVQTIQDSLSENDQQQICYRNIAKLKLLGNMYQDNDRLVRPLGKGSPCRITITFLLRNIIISIYVFCSTAPCAAEMYFFLKLRIMGTSAGFSALAEFD